MSANSQKGIDIEIMGQQHQIACPKGEEAALIDAAQYLDKMFWDIKQRSGIRNNERALLMTALTLSHELLQTHKNGDSHKEQIHTLINSIKQTVDTKID